MQEKKIGEIIAEAREKAGYSQRQLAKEANISNAELSKIESGERERTFHLALTDTGSLRTI